VSLRSTASAGLVLALLVILPRLAAACSQCLAANDENRMAFLVTTGILTFLPLGLMGAAGVFFWRRARRMALRSGRPLPRFDSVADYQIRP
jgi:hypothetical protein